MSAKDMRGFESEELPDMLAKVSDEDPARRQARAKALRPKPELESARHWLAELETEYECGGRVNGTVAADIRKYRRRVKLLGGA